MSEILSNIVVEQTNINFTPNNNNLNVTPEAIQLNVFTAAGPIAAGSNTTVQYNDSGVFNGSNAFTFNNTSNTVTIANIVATNSNLGNIANVKIAGGSNGQILITDGAGNLSFSISAANANYANFAGNVVNSAQPNITSVGNLTGLNMSGTSNLGPVGNVKITGGTNGYVLQTDGAGNLDWAAMTGGGGNGAPGGSNTQIQYNDSGLFGGASGFTFNEVTGNVAIPGSLTVNTVINGTLATASQPNITGLGTIAALNVGFISLSGNLNANGTIAALNFNGSGNLLTDLNGANVTGTVANATTATTAGTVTTNSQPNITSVGTLSSLSVTGNLASGNANLGNLATANFFQGDGSLLSNINGANITGNLSRIANGTSNVSIPSANGNITFNVGGVANIAVISNTALNTSNLRLSSNTIILGLNTPNTVGPDSIVIGNAAGTALVQGAVVIGDQAGKGADGAFNVTLGRFARQNGSSNSSISIGAFAGRNSSSGSQVFLGHAAGTEALGGLGAVGIGYNALASAAGTYQIGIGYLAAANGDSEGGIAIGHLAGYQNQGNYAVAIGHDVASNNQGAESIAIGFDAGGNDQGINSIAIGAKAGTPTGTANNSIVLNATGAGLTASTANTLVVKPIRETNNLSLSLLDYNTTTGEISSHLRTFGSFTSNATQTSNGANTTNYVTLNNTEDANGISIASSTQVTVARIGRYNIQFSAQLEKTDGGTDIIEIWLDKNGTAVANTATQLELRGSGAKEVAAWDFNVNAANVNDYFRLAWASPDTAVQITAVPGANTISGVAIPSVILDINPIGA